MNILSINHEDIYPPYVGSKRAVFTSLYSLAKRGHSITHISWSSGPPQNIIFNNFRIINFNNSKVTNTLTLKNTKNEFFTKIGTTFHISQFYTLLDKGLLIKDFQNIINTDEYDVIIHEGPDGSQIPLQISKVLNVPLVERIHWAGPPRLIKNYKEWINYIHYNPFLSSLLFKSDTINYVLNKMEEKSILNRDIILVVSVSDENIVKNWGLSKVKLLLLPYGEIPDIYKDKNDQHNLKFIKNPYVVFSAPLNISVNYLSALFILKLAKELRNVNFIILGGGKEYFRNYSIPENFIPLGFIENKVYQEIMSNADIIIIPQIIAHGLQMKLIEGFFYGKCMITTSIVAQELPNIIPDKHLIINDIPETWSSMIKNILYDHSTMEYISKNNKQYYYENLSPEIHAEHLEHIINNL